MFVQNTLRINYTSTSFEQSYVKDAFTSLGNRKLTGSPSYSVSVLLLLIINMYIEKRCTFCVVYWSAGRGYSQNDLEYIYSSTWVLWESVKHVAICVLGGQCHGQHIYYAWQNCISGSVRTTERFSEAQRAGWHSAPIGQLTSIYPFENLLLPN